MNTNRDLNYRLYIQKTYGFTRSSFHEEFQRYEVIRQGDTERIRQGFASAKEAFLKGAGKLSDDPVKNLRYHFIVAVALTSRICVRGGMEHDMAYTLSDIYIQRADKLTSCEKLFELFAEMELDFAARMKELKKTNVISLHIRKCIDYIYDHLHEELTVSVLSGVIGLNPSYLSKLFAKETGISIKEFITNAKISTAENLLKFSEFSYLEISLALGFSSQSAFISVFKKHKGITPKKYRELYYTEQCGDEDFAF
ncbi:MAG: helix-turn-helix transcriptional regulator [Oscillospiraceae bacterium]|nr:helix-turn-helix transcriptional regulator [Oscillospiraceae bacterium]